MGHRSFWLNKINLAWSSRSVLGFSGVRRERRHSFLKFTELLIAQSGGIFEATRFARPCEVSRSTIANYLSVLEATFVVHIVRPFSSHRATEIVSAPKVYAFDTGFMCYYRGWHDINFIIIKNKTEPVVIECKWSAAAFEPGNIRAFRRQYPHGINYVVTSDTDKAFSKTYDNIKV